MKLHAVRWLLVPAALLALGGTALAGPSSTTTTTTVVGPTTTTTTGPSTTTTTGVPTTTTTTTTTTVPTTTTTTTTTTTAAPTTTTSTTLAPGDLSGDRTFFDTKNLGKNTALLSIDLGGNQFCFAGEVEAVDATLTPNRRVSFVYESLGTVDKANAKKVQGDFQTVDLTLVITSLFDAPVEDFRGTVTSSCTLKGSLRKEGDRSKGRLRCELGDDFSAFGFNPADETDAALLESIQDAFTKRKGLRVKVDKGRVRFRHNGVESPPGDDVTLTCPSSPSPGPGPS